ncbi:MAG: LPXTG cell wall anchor domain-containing protein [Lachnospiraceae bacterium]|nr:LPXTG cell wall anchor domain-containing protein [Lachnospiraceae bacterium]
MKKRILALVAAATLVMGMTMSVAAAGSSSSSSVVANQVVVTTPTASTGTQTIGESTVDYFAETTTVTTSVAGATITEASMDTVSAAVTEANKLYGENSFVASVVELNVPAGTGAAEFTLGCPNVWKGQTVTILHQKADGTWEQITPSKVGNNYVTFTLTSYSPVAIVIDASKAPKTGDPMTAVAVMGMVSLAGAGLLKKRA